MIGDDDILRLEAHDLMHGASDEMLRLAAQGEIDLNRLAQWELRSRRGEAAAPAANPWP